MKPWHRIIALPLSGMLLMGLGCGNDPATNDPPPDDRYTLPERDPRTATFAIRNEFWLAVPQGAQKVRIWFPLPQGESSEFGIIDTSEISNFQFNAVSPANMTWTRHRDSDGSEIGYAEFFNPDFEEIRFNYTFNLTRTEIYMGSLRPHMTRDFTDSELAANYKYLEANEHIPAHTPRLQELVAQIVGNETNPLVKHDLIYTWMLENLSYWVLDPANTKASATGDTEWCLDFGHGNCSDFHSAYAALARTAGIPTRQTYGGLLKDELNGLAVDASYHCWSLMYMPELGWVEQDVSVADLWYSQSEIYNSLSPEDQMRVRLTAGSNFEGQAEAPVEYYRYNMDERRVLWTIGRDLELSPRQLGPPVNHMLRGYFEIDDQVPEWSWANSALNRLLTFEEVNAPIPDAWPVE